MNDKNNKSQIEKNVLTKQELIWKGQELFIDWKNAIEEEDFKYDMSKENYESWLEAKIKMYEFMEISKRIRVRDDEYDDEEFDVDLDEDNNHKDCECRRCMYGYDNRVVILTKKELMEKARELYDEWEKSLTDYRGEGMWDYTWKDEARYLLRAFINITEYISFNEERQDDSYEQ
ncbi:MAG: hypothetical protein ACRCUM_04015 [Mycoplasmoidaceae bacterium]